MPGIPIEKLIQRQIHQWSRYRELLGPGPQASPPPRRPTITISRELGAGAREVAAALAARLDLEVHGVGIVDRIARDENLAREVVDALDEKARSQVELWVEGVLKQRIFLRDNYHVALVRTVETLAAHGGVLLIGRGANFILGEQASLRVLLVASRKRRIERVTRYEDVDEAEAARLVDRADGERAEFIRKLFHAEANDPRHYDLVLGTDRYPLPRVAEIVMAALEVRGVFSG
jgi:cytidylate kinase